MSIFTQFSKISVFRAAVLLINLLIFAASPQAIAQTTCNAVDIIDGSSSSSVGGLCLAFWSSTENAGDNSLSTAASYDNISLGLGCSASVSVTSGVTYPAGSTVGVVVSGGGGTIFGNLLGSFLTNTTIQLLNNGSVVQTISSQSGLIDVTNILLLGLGDSYGAIGGIANVPYNGYRVTFSFAIGAFNGVQVYGAAVRGGCLQFANCGSSVATSNTGSFIANGTPNQQGTLVVPISTSQAGTMYVNVSGGGFTSNQTYTQVNLSSGQTTVSIPVTYDGSGTGGIRTITVTSYNVAKQASGSCVATANVASPFVAPPTVTTTPNPVVVTQTATFVASGCAGTVTWYNNGVAIGTGSSLTVTPTAGSTYTATCTTNGTTSTPNVIVVIPSTVNTPVVSSTPTQIISGQSATLTASSCAGTVTWYNNGSNIGTGSTITVAVTPGSSYTATCTVNGVVSTPSSPLSVPASVTSPTTTSTPSPLVANQTATLTATNCSGTVTWYNNATVIGTGPSITITPVAGQNYTATCTVTGVVSPQSTPITVPLVVNPPTITSSPTPLVSGQQATLTATNCAGTVVWYLNGAAIGTGSSITVVPSANSIYTATCTVQNVVSNPSTTIAVPVPITPPTVVSTPSPLVANQQATLTANNCTGTVTWYNNGMMIGLGSSITIVPTVGSNYTATCTVNTTTSPNSTPIAVTNVVNPPTVTSSPNPLVAGQQSTLTASNCSGTVNWYANGNLVGVGVSLTIVPTAGTTYTATCTVSNTMSQPSSPIAVTTNSQDYNTTISSLSFGQFLLSSAKSYVVNFTNTLTSAASGSVQALITAPFGWNCTGCGTVTIPVLGASQSFAVPVTLTAQNAGAAGNLTSNITTQSGGDTRSDNNTAIIAVRTGN